jgi:hypothetical protein
VETLGFKGLRDLDASGLPLHADNQTIVKERIFLDHGNRNLLHDRITTVDHAYMKPWTVTRDYRRDLHPVWVDTPVVPTIITSRSRSKHISSALTAV